MTGGSSWEKWKKQRSAAGLPVVDVPEARGAPPVTPRKQSRSRVKPDPTEVEAALINPEKTGAARVLP